VRDIRLGRSLAAGSRFRRAVSGPPHFLRRPQLRRAPKEMGGDGREQPFFFCKSAHDTVPIGNGETGAIHSPPKTKNYHYETKMVVALSIGGRNIESSTARGHVWGYAVGLDMTRRDLRQLGKDKGRPWTFGKDFDQAAPVGPITPAAVSGRPAHAGWWLKANGEIRQKANIAKMIWNVPDQIAVLSQHYTLEGGHHHDGYASRCRQGQARRRARRRNRGPG